LKTQAPKILIIQTAFIGDVILALPLVQRIKEYFPDAYISFLVRKGNESLVQSHPDINQVYIWNKNNDKYKNLTKCIQALRKEHYTLAINCQRFLSTGILMAFINADVKIGFKENPFSFTFDNKFPHIMHPKGHPSPIHEISRNLSLLSGICPTHIEPPRLFPDAEAFIKADQLTAGRRYLILAPASVWFTKQWPTEYWIELVKALPENLLPIVIGAKIDNALGNEVLKHRPDGLNLCGKLSLLESAALMKGSVRVICNDSAPLHLASAVNAPVTAIFCSTIPEFGFFPLSENQQILESPEALSCRPCGLHGYNACPQKHFICAYSILPQMVLNTI